MENNRGSFATSLSAVFAMAGSAIGLGNIWRFPYMVGQNGGAAFVLLYLLCVVFIAIPIFMCESVIGRRTGLNPHGAMQKLAPGTKWNTLALLSVFTPLVVLSFYSVVGGWSIGFLGRAIAFGFGDDASLRFAAFSSSWWKPLLCHTAFMAATAFIVMKGVEKGIEKFNNISLPLLFVMIVVIAVYSMTLPGASEGVRYLVKPDFSQINARSFAYAMGQAFFSLSLGVGTILTYSSYMRKDSNLLRSGAGTAAFDLMFAFIAGLAVMPAVFAAGIEPGAGPGLIFETLPFIFSQMGEFTPIVSRAVSILFFLVIVTAALTSSISMGEVGVAYLVDEKNFSRKKAVILLFSCTWLLGALCSLSFGPLSGVHIFGQTIFSFCDTLTSNFLMTFGALLFVIFVGWKMDRESVRSEIGSRIFPVLYFLIRYIAPVTIVAIFLTNFIL